MTREREIPLAVPEIHGKEWQYVKECLDTGWVSSVGEYVTRFEKIVAGYIGRAHAIACTSGTAALHTALLLAGIQPGDEVILPDISFVAPANAVHYAGGYPVFVDVDPEFWQLDPDKVGEFLTKGCVRRGGQMVNRQTNRPVKAILPVHLLGHPVDMDPVCALADRFGLTVIEDAAESLGAVYKGRKTGGIGHLACLSFNGNKIITTGGGGMVLTDNPEWAARARYLTTQAKDDPVESVHHEVGYNYRLTNVQAAIGVAQMERLEEYIVLKRRIAGRYQEGLAGATGITMFKEAEGVRSIYWLSTILVDPEKRGLSSRDLLRLLSGERIQARPLWCPLHQLKPFASCTAFAIEVANRLYRQALSLPSSVGLQEEDQEKIIRIVKGGLSVRTE